MMKVFAILFAAAGLASAQEPETPRVTGENDADETTIIINELNTDEYPDVLILATVLRSGEPLTGLEADDFRVREDEVDQEPLTVEPQLPPLSVVVALDGSGSMSDRMAETQEAAKQFVGSLGEGESVQLVRFAREIETVTPMTSTKSNVQEAIDTVAARGDTALYDALYRSVELVSERRGRKAIVLLSDGVDDDGTGQPLSTHTIEDVLDRAAEVNVPIFVIGLGSEMDEAVLTDIAETTGAQYLNAPSADELGKIYGRISDQLSGQYAIRYTSSLPADGTARRVDLRALGSQDSKSYTPSGTATASADAAGECGMAAAMRAARTDLEEAAERYDEDLITVTDRDAVRDETYDRIEEAAPQAPAAFDCIRDALTVTAELYDDRLIAVTARKGLRDILVDTLEETCAQKASVEDQVECLTFYRNAYDDSLISVTARDDLREEAFDRLIPLLAAEQETDDALAFVGELYNEKLIAVTARDDARETLLEAEGG